MAAIPSLTRDTWNVVAGDEHRMFLWLPGHPLGDSPQGLQVTSLWSQGGNGTQPRAPLSSNHTGSLATVLGKEIPERWLRPRLQSCSLRFGPSRPLSSMTSHSLGQGLLLYSGEVTNGSPMHSVSCPFLPGSSALPPW